MCSRGPLSGKSVTLCARSSPLTISLKTGPVSPSIVMRSINSNGIYLCPAATQLTVIQLTRKWITCGCLNAHTLDLLDFISSLHKGRIKIKIHTKQNSTKSRSKWIWLRMGVGEGQPSNWVKTSPFSNGFANFLFSQAKRTGSNDKTVSL